METSSKIVRKFCKVEFIGDQTVTQMIVDSDSKNLDNGNGKKSTVKVNFTREKICESITEVAKSSIKTRSWKV